MFDRDRCRGCQFHSCLTWLHCGERENKQRFKCQKVQEWEKNTTNSRSDHGRGKENEYWNYEKCHSNAHMWYIQWNQDEITLWILSISRMAQRSMKINRDVIHKCVCFIAVWCEDLSHTLVHLNGFDGCSQWRWKKNSTHQRSKLVE